MQVLRLGSIGPDVQRWQHFLLGQGHYVGSVVEGNFGPKTRDATVQFQRAVGLTGDGEVGRLTFAKAIERGFGEVHDGDAKSSPNWPPRGAMVSPSQAMRDQMFGRFKFKPDPVEGNRERIEVLDDWVKQNLVEVVIPQLKGIKGAPADCSVKMHRKVGPRAQLLFREWEKAGLLHLVLTFDGTYAARFVRGSTTTLSAHSHGSAFDINARWNPIGAEPPLVGKEGDVRELAEIAGNLGWWWGGWYKSRKDGMHFEVAKLM